jgi:hypothetical protein
MKAGGYAAKNNQLKRINGASLSELLMLLFLAFYFMKVDCMPTRFNNLFTYHF